MEKYSVLMSLYIKEKPEYLKLAVDSMARQTLKPDEIVIVLDGEITKEQREVLEACSLEYPDLIKIVGYEQNQGLGFALNFGLSHCRNELVARMDTDDIARAQRCERQLKLFEKNPDLDMIGSSIQEFVETPGNVAGKRCVPVESDQIEKYLKTRCPFNHMTVMFKKSAVLAAGGYKDWFWNEDYYLWLRMFLNGCKFQNIEECLVDVRVGRDMYKRRGGMKYFKSEAKLQGFMLKNKIIGLPTYAVNVAKRLIVQVLLPNWLRGWVFKKFARE